MRSRYRVVTSEAVYFLTATVVEWLPVFYGDDVCGILTTALSYCRKAKGLRIYAYVVMENHLHLVAEAPDLVRAIQPFKRYTARQIVQWAEATHKTWLLNQLAYFKKKYKTTSTYQVWQEGAHPQLLANDAMLQQKIRYIHENPVRRGYVEAPEHWRYSSARNYMLDDDSVLRIDRLGD